MNPRTSMLFAALAAAAPAGATTFTVTNTNDSGAGSLRAAMLAANAQQEGGLGMLDELRHQVHALDHVVFGGGWKAGSDPAWVGIDPDRSLGQWNRGGEVEADGGHGITVVLSSIPMDLPGPAAA